MQIGNNFYFYPFYSFPHRSFILLFRSLLHWLELINEMKICGVWSDIFHCFLCCMENFVDFRMLKGKWIGGELEIWKGRASLCLCLLDMVLCQLDIFLFSFFFFKEQLDNSLFLRGIADNGWYLPNLWERGRNYTACFKRLR